MHDLRLILRDVLGHVVLLSESVLIHRAVVQTLVHILVPNLLLKANWPSNMPLEVSELFKTTIVG